MREIKFRAWNPQQKRMLFPTHLKFVDGEIEVAEHNPRNICPDPSFYAFDENILMQFTGLKDKDGKDIYEGDIVKAWSQGSCANFEIKWRQEGSPCWILFPAWQGGKMWHISASEHTKGKQFLSVSGDISTTDKEGYYDDGLEVIGNKYENPELLKD